MENGPDLPRVDDIREAQRRDPTLRRIIARLLPVCKKGTSTEGVPIQPSGKNQEQFFMRDHVLLRRANELERFSKRPSVGSKAVTQLCVPKEMRRAILYHCHGSPMAGHNGAKRTFVKLQQTFWWRGYEADCTKWVQSCFLCQRKKTPQPKRQGLTGSLLAQTPFDTVGFDIVGPYSS